MFNELNRLVLAQLLVTSSRPLVTSSGPLVTSSRPLVTSSRPLVTSSRPLVTSSRPLFIYVPVLHGQGLLTWTNISSQCVRWYNRRWSSECEHEQSVPSCCLQRETTSASSRKNSVYSVLNTDSHGPKSIRETQERSSNSVLKTFSF